MQRKQYLSFVLLGVIVIAVTVFFKDPVDSKEVVQDIDYQAELVARIDELQARIWKLQHENRTLQEENKYSNEIIYTLFKFMYSSESVYEIFEFPETTKVSYSEIDDERFVVFFHDARGYRFGLYQKEDKQGEYKEIVASDEIISWAAHRMPDTYLIAGISSNKDVTKVQINEKGNIHEGKIISLDDKTDVWFSFFDYTPVTDSTFKSKNNMGITALDKNGSILWEEYFIAERARKNDE